MSEGDAKEGAGSPAGILTMSASRTCHSLTEASHEPDSSRSPRRAKHDTASSWADR